MVVVHVPILVKPLCMLKFYIALLLKNRSNDVYYRTFYMLVCRLACLWVEVTARNSSRMTVRCCSRVVSSLLPVSLSIYLSLSPSLSLSLSVGLPLHSPRNVHITAVQTHRIYTPFSLSLAPQLHKPSKTWPYTGLSSIKAQF